MTTPINDDDNLAPKPKHVPGDTVYVGLRTYDLKTRKMRHRASIKLAKWSVEEVRRIIVEAFQAHQKGHDGHVTPRT